MKKLMIAAAIVCAAAMSHAAMISWGAELVYDSDGSTLLQAGDFQLAKLVGETWTTVDSASLEYDDGYNYVGGAYTLVVDQDADGDKFTLMNNGAQVTDLSGNALVYTLSGFGNDPKSTGVPSFDVSGAKVAAVPEPTSGLLLLLGVAGMALRRRRA